MSRKYRQGFIDSQEPRPCLRRDLERPRYKIDLIDNSPFLNRPFPQIETLAKNKIIKLGLG
jgi:hypothetical protein